MSDSGVGVKRRRYPSRTLERIAPDVPAVYAFVGAYGVGAHQDGVGLDAHFGTVGGLLISTDHRSLYVADSGNHVIRHVDTDTSRVTTIAGVPGVSGDTEGAASEALLTYPSSPFFDHVGRLLFRCHRTIVQLEDGQVKVLDRVEHAHNWFRLGNLISIPPSVAAHKCGLEPPSPIILFTNHDHISRLVNGSMVQFAGSSFFDNADSDGPKFTRRTTSLKDACFKTLRGIAQVEDDPFTLYVLDGSHHCIYALSLQDRTVSILAGGPRKSCAIDGVGADAGFYWPDLMTPANNGRGDLLVKDGMTLRRVTTRSTLQVRRGTVTTIPHLTLERYCSAIVGAGQVVYAAGFWSDKSCSIRRIVLPRTAGDIDYTWSRRGPAVAAWKEQRAAMMLGAPLPFK